MSNTSIQYAGFGVRLIALLLDTLILALPLIIIISIVSGGDFFDISAMQEVIAQAQRGDINALQHAPKTDMTWELIFEIAMATLIIIFWKKWMGATPGKKLMGITVVDAKTFKMIDNKQAITRYIGYIVSTIPFLLGFVMVIFRKDRRALHDVLANTAVIYVDKS